MRITELLEGKHFNDLQFIKTVSDDGDKELDFDLGDDLSFFMHNHDDAYRKYTHPVIVKILKLKKTNANASPSIFAKAVTECYKMYSSEYPIRELQSELDEDTLRSICKKVYEEACQHIEDGKYE